MKNVFFAILLLFAVSCKSQNAQQADVNADEFEKLILEPGAQLLDVRTAREFSQGHLKNALQADWTKPEEFKERVKFLDKSKPVLVYCLAGSRSASASSWLLENGFTTITDLKGGINAWKIAAKPLEAAKQEKQLTMEEYLSMIPANKTTLVDVGASWCPPCVKMDPVINSLKEDKSVDFELIKVDAGVHTNLLNELKIEPIPVFIIYKNGKEVWRKQGILSKEELISQLK